MLIFFIKTKLKILSNVSKFSEKYFTQNGLIFTIFFFFQNFMLYLMLHFLFSIVKIKDLFFNKKHG